MKKIQRHQYLNNEHGIVLVVVMILVAVSILIGTSSIFTSGIGLKISGNSRLGTQAFYASEAGAEFAFSRLKNALRVINPIITDESPTIIGYAFDECSITSLGMQAQEETTGTYAGLTAFITQYRITSKAHVNGTNATAETSLLVKDNLIPIFQFGIFYDGNLEILPGSNMTFSGGRIHSNSNIYMNADGGTLSIDAMITSAGNIIHGHLDSRSHSTTNTVRIKDGNDDYQTMNIDSNSANWASEALETWDGNVKDKAHGCTSLTLPTSTGSGAARDLTGTGSDSLYAKSGLRIINGTAYDKDLNVIDITYTSGGATVNPISTKSFTDKREGKVVTVTEIDIAKLQNSTTAMNALNNPPPGCDPGILYVNQTNNTKSVRLTNGATIPSTGLTVVSNNPVYIKGNYNEANNPSAILGDAVTFLSNNWNDSNSSQDLSYRSAGNTTVNAAIMAGNVPTPGGTSTYSGGVENFPRFLENWTGKTFTYGGSIVCLWESNQATGPWSYGSYYTAPNRIWSYGINPANLPPGTPKFRLVEKLAWHHNIF
jgi:hypothetical protein